MSRLPLASSDEIAILAAVRRVFSRVVRSACLMGVLSLASSCWHNPASGRAELALISEDEEVRLGRQLDQEVRESVAVYEDARWTDRVTELGKRVAEISERDYLPWTFRVLDDPSPNAFALPGGHVYVTRGLLVLLGSDAELEAVLAHEIGHVTARHSVNQLSRTAIASRGLGVFRILDPQGRHVGGFAAAAVQLRLLRHSRVHEFQADDLGTRYTAELGGDPTAMIDVLETLRRLGERTPEGRVPSHLSTHPEPELRNARQAQRWNVNASAGGWRHAIDPDYVRRLDRVQYGSDPRQGYVVGQRFVHPKAGLTVEFPIGWTVQSLSGTAVGSDAEQTGVVMVGTTVHESAAAAEQAFFSTEGFERRDTWVETISGKPVRARRFVLNDGAERYPGWAVFAQWHDHVHMALGMAEADGSVGAEQVRSALLTLDEPTDRKLVDVAPMRVRVVETSTATTLRRIAEREAASLDVDMLALMNRVDADASLPAEATVRMVAGFNPERG